MSMLQCQTTGQVLKEFQELPGQSSLPIVLHDVSFMNQQACRELPSQSLSTLGAHNLYPRHGLGPLTKRFQIALEFSTMASYLTLGLILKSPLYLYQGCVAKISRI